MARQFTKILICTTHENDAKKYHSYLKKNRSLRTEIIIETVPQNLLHSLEGRDVDLLILDQDIYGLEPADIAGTLFKKDNRIPCLIISDESVTPFIKELIQQDIIFSIVAESWLDEDIFNWFVLRLINAHKKKIEHENLHQTDRSLLNNIPGMAFRRRNDKWGTLTYVSDGCKDLTGYTASELLNSQSISYFSLIHPDDRKMVRDAVAYRLSRDSNYQISYRILDAHDGLRWVRESGNSARASDWKDPQIEGLIVDISDQMKLMEEHQKDKDELQKIYDYVFAAIGIIEKRTFVEVNDYFCKLFGYDRSEIIGQSTRILYQNEEDFNRFGLENNLELDKKGFGTFSIQYKKKDGSLLDVIVTTSRFSQNDREGPVSFVIMDISEQVKTKQLLRENEEKRNLLIQHMSEGIFFSDEKGMVLEWSDSLERMIAIPREEVVGVPFDAMIDRLIDRRIVKVDGEKAKQFLRQAFEDRKKERFNTIWEGEMLTPQGDYQTFLAELFTIQSPKGNGLAIIVRNIDAQKKHEKELQLMADLTTVIRKCENDAVLVRKSVIDILMSSLNLDGIAMASFVDNGDGGTIVEARGRFAEKIGTKISWKNCIEQASLYGDSIFEIGANCLEKLCPAKEFIELPKTRISISLVNGRDRVGMIFAFHKERFSEYEYRLLDAVGNVVAGVLNQAMTFERTELRLKRLESLHVIDQAISGLFNLDLTNRIILDQAKQQLGADAGDILILNMATNMMEYSAIFGFDHLDVEEKRVHLSRSMAGQILLNREPCVVSDISKHELPFIMKHLQRHSFHAYFGFPLIAKGEPKGVMEIYMQTPFQPDTEWLNFLQSLATQSSIAIDNIQLFEKMQSMQYF